MSTELHMIFGAGPLGKWTATPMTEAVKATLEWRREEAKSERSGSPAKRGESRG